MNSLKFVMQPLVIGMVQNAQLMCELAFHLSDKSHFRKILTVQSN